MFDYQEIFHVGMLVSDIDAAMAEIGEPLGLTWARVQHVAARSVWTPEQGAREVALTFVYSRSGPQHIELLCGDVGSVWDPTGAAGVHHVGVWADDVPAEVDRFVAAGWRLVAAANPPDEGYGSFAYVAPSSGLIVELVTSAAKPRFDTWFAGGSLGSDRDPVADA